MATLRETLLSQNAYKSVETEGFLDLYFYRPGGAILALAGMRLGLSPNLLTAASLVTGVAGACLLYWDSWMWVGIGLIVLSGLFDASDGQLARMTHSTSLNGRILDGVADYVVCITTYLSLAFKYLNLNPEASPVPIFVLVAVSGISHSLQSSLFDYYRNEYAEYVDRRRIPVPDFDENAEPPADLINRFLQWCHRDYTLRQKKLARSHVELGRILSSKRPDGKLDEEFAKNYKDLNLPLIWWWNLMGLNSRLLVVIAALAAGRPELYFWAEVTLYNLCAFVIHRRQVNADRTLLRLTV